MSAILIVILCFLNVEHCVSDDKEDDSADTNDNLPDIADTNDNLPDIADTNDNLPEAETLP